MIRTVSVRFSDFCSMASSSHGNLPNVPKYISSIISADTFVQIPDFTILAVSALVALNSSFIILSPKIKINVPKATTNEYLLFYFKCVFINLLPSNS